MKKLSALGLLFLLIFSFVTPVLAAQDEIGQFSINPGGGRGTASSPTGGLRVNINSNADGTTYLGSSNAGSDQFWFGSTYQYCCSAGSPYLSIGGIVYGSSGYASEKNWSDVQLVSKSGSTVDSTDRSSTATGNATLVLDYIANEGGLTYVMRRSITYVYPNNYIRETYTFTIPSGNTSQINFYIGGDTAPGSSDSGKGLKIDGPPRSISSVNQSSGIQFGFREVVGSDPFDHIFVGQYSAPRSTVQAGGNLNDSVNLSSHDAGLMAQWIIGTTPGTYTRSMDQFVSKVETSVYAIFDDSEITDSANSNITFFLENGQSTAVDDVGFSFALPENLYISGAATNSCASTTGTSLTLTAVLNSDSIELAGVDLAGLGSCTLKVPVKGPINASGYQITSARLTPTLNITNNTGNSTLVVVDSNTSAPVFVNSSPSSAIISTAYSYNFLASGSPSSTYSVSAGSLPAGLTLSPSGELAGTATTLGDYSFTVTASNGISPDASVSVNLSVIAAATSPSAPTGLTATAGDSQTSLSWTAGSDGGSAITDYVIEYSTDNSTWTTFSDGTSTSTSATVTGLTNGTLYYFRVKATNNIGTGSASSNATATPTAPAASSGGGSSNPTATPTPTPTPTPTQTPRTRRTILPTPNQTPQALLPRITPSPTPTSTQTPQAGSPTRPVELVKKAIEEVVEVLKPRIVDLNTLINSTANPDPVASANASRAVSALPTPQALGLVEVPEEQKRVADIPSSVLKDGVPEESRIIVVQETKSQVVTGDGGLLTVEAKAGDESVPVDSRGRVQMVRENSVETEGQGMAPESEFAVYLFSDPLLLGVGKTDLAGRFFASFPVEDELPLGDHTLQVVGITPTGEQRTVSMPVVVVEDKETAKAQALPETILVDQNPVEAWYESINYLLTLLLVLILVSLWLLFGVRRRRKDEEL